MYDNLKEIYIERKIKTENSNLILKGLKEEGVEGKKLTDDEEKELKDKLKDEFDNENKNSGKKDSRNQLNDIIYEIFWHRNEIKNKDSIILDRTQIGG